MGRIDETEVETRHKRTLEKLSEKEQVYDDRGDRELAEGSRRSIEDIDGTITPAFRSGETQGRSGETQGRTAQGKDGYSRAGAQRMESGEGASRRHDQGIRSVNTESQYPIEGHDRVYQPPG